MGRELAANLHARPMDTEQVRHFANTLLEVDAAGSDATARHRRERATGKVKLWNSSPTIAPIAGVGGRPTTPSPNTSTTSCRSEEPAPPATPAPPVPCAGISAAGSTQSMKAQAFRMLQTP
jgi:hypothetical protein